MLNYYVATPLKRPDSDPHVELYKWYMMTFDRELEMVIGLQFNVVPLQIIIINSDMTDTLSHYFGEMPETLYLSDSITSERRV